MTKNYYKKSLTLAIVLALVFLIVWLYLADFSKGRQVEFGVTFSSKYAAELELDWQTAFLSLLDDLGVRKFRLIAYWDKIESQPGKYDFSDLDWELAGAAKRGGEVLLVIGSRVPRWPECHWPTWIFGLSDEERQAGILKLLKETVKHFKSEEAIIAWQVENEPYLNIFGECPKLDEDFYEQEVELVKSLDERPVAVTESGELSSWLKGSRLADIVGTSLYRITWNKWFGYFYYPLPPAHYYLKSRLVKLATGIDNIFISEMQMEPWVARKILLTSLEEQSHSMNPEIFVKNINYAKRTGLSPVYFWGAEWWYWLKEQGDDSIWQAAKDIWNNYQNS